MKITLELRALAWALIVASLSLVCAGLTAIFLQKLPAPVSSPESPTNIAIASADLLPQGQQSYEMSCSDCHGDDAHGDEGPDLHNLAISNARIKKVIKGGIQGQMPGFAKKYSDAQVAALVSYLRTLQ